MNAEIAELKARAWPGRTTALNSDRGNASASMLDKAAAHLNRAAEYIVKHDTRDAAMELDKSRRLLETSREQAAGPVKSTINTMEKQMQDFNVRLDRMRKAWDKN